MKIKAVIFDLDGTLVDSMWMWKQIDIEFLGRYGFDVPDDLERIIEGMSFSETAVYFKERFELPLTLEEIKTIWNEMAFDKYSNEVPLKQGAAEFLHYLSEKKIVMGIATSNSRELVDAVTKALHIEHYFASITTACEVMKVYAVEDAFSNDLKCEKIELADGYVSDYRDVITEWEQTS